MGWIAASCEAALFAGLVSILSKLGVRTTDPDVATAVRTVIVAIAAWCVAALGGPLSSIPDISPTTWLFLALSGLATGGSWMRYYYAIQTGVVSTVVQIDKLSVLVSVLFAFFVLKERLAKRAAFGLVLMVIGTAVMAAFS